MGTRHEAAWRWFAALERGAKPPALIACWPRGGGKSTTIELGCVYASQRRARSFVLYVSATQTQADAHLQAIAAKLESIGVERAMNKYQQSRGWTQQILRAANGFNVVSLGLDAAARGIKLDDYRPDLIVLDDVDARHDSAAVVAKKIETLTQSILPSGADDAAVVFVQNKIHDTSIMAQVIDGRADMLQHREPPLVEPAVRDLQIAQVAQPDGTMRYTVSGAATWPGQSLEVCTAQINEWGRQAFLREAQHETKANEAGLWKTARDLHPHRVATAPDLARVVVAIDPAATSGGDEAGIVVAGVSADGHGYVLADLSFQGSPAAWAARAVQAYHDYHADRLVAESNNGGEMVGVVIGTVDGAPRVKLLHASRGKLTRAEPVQNLYERGLVHHVGVLGALEDELTTWQPGDASPNRLDALVWALTELMLGARVALR